MTVYITRKIEFDAGHRVLGHESKCAHLHGHRYVAEITVRAKDNALDALSRVIDFSCIKSVVGGWVDENWDHNILLNSKDPLLNAYVPCEGEHWDKMQREPDSAVLPITKRPIFGGKGPFVFVDMNPTAETMSQVLFEKASALLDPLGMAITLVRIYETPNCWADCYEGTKKRDK